MLNVGPKRRVINAAKNLRAKGFNVRVNETNGAFIIAAIPDPSFVPAPPRRRAPRSTPTRAKVIAFATNHQSPRCPEARVVIAPVAAQRPLSVAVAPISTPKGA